MLLTMVFRWWLQPYWRWWTLQLVDLTTMLTRYLPTQVFMKTVVCYHRHLMGVLSFLEVFLSSRPIRWETRGYFNFNDKTNRYLALLGLEQTTNFNWHPIKIITMVSTASRNFPSLQNLCFCSSLMWIILTLGEMAWVRISNSMVTVCLEWITIWLTEIWHRSLSHRGPRFIEGHCQTPFVTPTPTRWEAYQLSFSWHPKAGLPLPLSTFCYVQ